MSADNPHSVELDVVGVVRVTTPASADERGRLMPGVLFLEAAVTQPELDELEALIVVWGRRRAREAGGRGEVTAEGPTP